LKRNAGVLLSSVRSTPGVTAKCAAVKGAEGAAMPDLLLTAVNGTTALFACVCDTTRETDPRVSDHRLAAVLRPYRSREDAAAALVAAGGGDVREWKR